MYSPWGPTMPRWIRCHSSFATACSRWSTTSAPPSAGLTVPLKVARLRTPVSSALLSSGPWIVTAGETLTALVGLVAPTAVAE